VRDYNQDAPMERFVSYLELPEFSSFHYHYNDSLYQFSG
jgi:hypothetical protein